MAAVHPGNHVRRDLSGDEGYIGELVESGADQSEYEEEGEESVIERYTTTTLLDTHKISSTLVVSDLTRVFHY